MREIHQPAAAPADADRGTPTPISRIAHPAERMYVCPDCKCDTISDKPGKCGCGKEMKKLGG
jgi:hypothetical protein